MFEWVSDALGWIATLAESLVLTILEMLKDLFCWCAEQIFTLLLHILNQLPTGPLLSFSPQSYIGSLAAEIVNMLGLLGAGTCLTMIVAALIVRFFLQLIPFTRLGS